MGSQAIEVKNPWIKTPCIQSSELTRIAGCNIYLKLDNLQPSGSFKSRGIGNFMTRAAKASNRHPVHFYCTSGGNAGLACATCAIALGCRATIVLPTIAPALMKKKLLALGVKVKVAGNFWADADKFLREDLLTQDPNGLYVPPFDHEDVWDGASSIVTEIREQLDVPVHGIVCSVGGGGMVNGIMQAVESLPWQDQQQPPTVIAVETTGADSLNASIRAGEHITLPGIKSIAHSLGATRVSERTWRWSQESKHMRSKTVTDADAAISCVRFADDERMLVEVACGATLAVAYRGDLRRMLGSQMSDEDWARQNVVLEVCGGVGVTMEMLTKYREEYSMAAAIKTTGP